MELCLHSQDLSCLEFNNLTTNDVKLTNFIKTSKDIHVTSDHRILAPSNGSISSMILHAADFITSGDLPIDAEDSFYMVDIGACVKLYQHLDKVMPRVKPHYAIKCFPNPMLLAALANEGAGFDCASKNELEMVMKLGVDPRYT